MSSLRQEANIIERFRIVEYAHQESIIAAARRFECSCTTVYSLGSAIEKGACWRSRINLGDPESRSEKRRRRSWSEPDCPKRS